MKFEVHIDNLPYSLESTEKIYKALEAAGLEVWDASYEIESYIKEIKGNNKNYKKDIK